MSSQTIANPNSIVRINPADHFAAAGIMARAFSRNDNWKYILVQEDRTEADLEWWWAGIIRYAEYFCQNYISAGHDGVALWSAPGRYDDSLFTALRAGLYQAPFKLGWKPFSRIMKLMNLIGKAHSRWEPGPHFYLMTLAVDPPKQGQGIGSYFLRDLTSRADAEAVPCYVESDDRRATDLYRRHGFQVVDEVWVSEGILWEVMVREPRGKETVSGLCRSV